MTQTVIAVFEKLSAAQAAVENLRQAGYSGDEIDLAAGGSARSKNSFSQFFAHLFQDGEEAERYNNAAAQAGAIVTLHVEGEERALEGANILDEAGASQVDDPNKTYESSSSLIGYQDVDENAAANRYHPEDYSAAPEYAGEDPHADKKSPAQIMREADARARILRAQVDKTLRLRD